MKKLSLLAAALMMAGATYAHEGKSCCKGKEAKECSKEASAAKKEACKEEAKTAKSSCCQKGEGSAKKECSGDAKAAETAKK